MRKPLHLVAALSAIALFAAACGGGSEDTTTTAAPSAEEASVLDLAEEAGQFSTLLAAIDAAGLGTTLRGDGPFTVFAPTDAAFDEAFTALGITADELLADTETLTSILTYHVLAVEADSDRVVTLDGQAVPTVNGASLTISVVDGTVMVDDAMVVTADLEADNGIVHVIDGVLLPEDVAQALGVAGGGSTTTTSEATTTTTQVPAEPTIADIVVEAAGGGEPQFTVLLAALEAAGLVDAVADRAAEFTVFAPTDEAFAALLDELGVTADELLADEGLAAILLYHVVPGVFTAEDVLAAAPLQAPTLLEGRSLTIEVNDGNVVIDETATVVQTDITASNGVIHVIDAVLVPPAVN